jgi:hypothetical protein
MAAAEEDEGTPSSPPALNFFFIARTHFPNDKHQIGFAYEVPARLEVGQEVTAYHKAAQLLVRGHILTVDYERGRYRVQFERPELGSEICAVRA